MKTKTASLIFLLILGFSTISFAQGRGNHYGQRKHEDNNNHDNFHPSREQVYYRHSPRVEAVRHLPNGYVAYRHRDRDYYFHEGRYYDYNNGRYIAITPPVGLRVHVLPVGCREYAFAARTYFYFGGLFYVLTHNEYEIAEPPVGAIVYELPEDTEKVRINGMTYYEYNGTLYQRVRTEMGRGFEVVGRFES